MKRYGLVLALKPEGVEEYRRLHADVWPDVLRQIEKSNIRNYSIFLKQPENLLFAYYEYLGSDHDADMREMAADPRTQEWWAVCMPLQQPLETRKDGEWWAEMTEIFHTE